MTALCSTSLADSIQMRLIGAYCIRNGIRGGRGSIVGQCRCSLYLKCGNTLSALLASSCIRAVLREPYHLAQTRCAGEWGTI